jgi:hypothetical protein
MTTQTAATTQFQTLETFAEELAGERPRPPPAP